MLGALAVIGFIGGTYGLGRLGIDDPHPIPAFLMGLLLDIVLLGVVLICIGIYYGVNGH